MQLIDLTVPLDWNLPVSHGHTPLSHGHTPLSLKPLKRIATRNRSHITTRRQNLRDGTTVRGGATVIEGCMPPRFVGADAPPPRVVLRKS
jgi:hypothetical protein